MTTRKPARRRKKPSKLAKKSGPWKISAADVAELLGIGATAVSGVEVTEAKVLSLSAVLCGLGRYAKLLASLPLNVYRRIETRREVAGHLAAHWLLHTEPNPEMTAYAARYAVEWNRLAGGKAVYEIEWADNGHPRYLWPLEAWRVQERRDEDGELYYLVDGQRRLAPGDVIYVPLISTDGVVGYSFIDYAIDTLGLTISAQELAGQFFANGAKPGGLLKHAGKPGDVERQKFKQEWEARRKKNPGSVGVVWGGWDYEDKGLAIPPDQAQLLESRVFGIGEIARLLDIPPILLHELTKSSWNNVELQNIFLLVYSLNPVLVSYEQEYDRKLLKPPTVYSKYTVEGLLRAESDKRAAFAKEQFMFGGMTINRWLELNDEDTIGPDGDVRFVPANMVPLHKALAAVAPEPTQVPKPTPAPDPERIPGGTGSLRPHLRTLLADTLARLARKEANAARRAVKEISRLRPWLESFYAEHVALVQASIEPGLAVAKAAGVCGAITAAAIADAWAARSRAELVALAESPATFAAEAERLLQSWETDRPQQVAAEVLP